MLVTQFYSINHLGEALRGGKILRRRVDKDGYFRQGFKIHQKCIVIAVHHLVWMYHYGDIPEGMCINHIDGNKKNNEISNLELVTPRGNTAHAIRTKLWQPRTLNIKYSKELVAKAKKMRDQGMAYNEIAKQLGTSPALPWHWINKGVNP